MKKWQPEKFWIATYGEPLQVQGFAYLGLGLDERNDWICTHLGTGFRIFGTKTWFLASKVGIELAEMCDWDWSGEQGHLNRDPDIRTKAGIIVAAYGDMVKWTKRASDDKRKFEIDWTAASQIARLRA